MRFPRQILLEAMAVFVLRIHGRLRLEEPLDNRVAAVAGCIVQRCVASGAAARGGGPRQATGRTQQKEGEKNSEKILGTSKVEVLEFVSTQKSSLNFMNTVVLRMF